MDPVGEITNRNKVIIHALTTVKVLHVNDIKVHVTFPSATQQTVRCIRILIYRN